MSGSPAAAATLLHPLPPEPPALTEGLPDVRYAGRCPVSGDELCLHPTAAAVAEARRLQAWLEARREAADGFRTGHLQEPAAGTMFGVMVCRDAGGRRGALRAFSGEWETWATPDGWVASPGDTEAYAAERADTEARSAALTRRIRDLQPLARTRADRRAIEELKIARGRICRALTDRIHAAYRVTNALGETLPLTEVDTGGARPPTGMGDCCAPKLLQAAIHLGLQPEGMVEFWWGSPSAVRPRQEGVFYSACREKCYPILGFLLRGIEAARVTRP